MGSGDGWEISVLLFNFAVNLKLLQKYKIKLRDGRRWGGKEGGRKKISVKY